MGLGGHIQSVVASIHLHVALGKYLQYLETQFPHLQNWDNNIHPTFMGLPYDLRRATHRHLCKLQLRELRLVRDQLECVFPKLFSQVPQGALLDEGTWH